MSIKSIYTDFAGQIGVKPRIVRIETDNTKDEVLVTNFLQGATQMGFQFNPNDLAAVVYGDNSADLFKVSITSSGISLVASVNQITGTHVTTWEGPIPATTGNITYTKTGNLVTLLFPGVFAIGNNTANNISATTALPASLRPLITFQEIKIVQTNGDLNRDPGMVQIASNGNMDWGKDSDFTAFDAVETEIGFIPMTVTYPVA